MGYAVYEDQTARDYGVTRWAGYAVLGVCDMPGCDVEIDRGMGYRCESGHEGDEGCGLHFCSDHRYEITQEHDQAEPKPDVPRWSWWMVNHESWAKWREENPGQLAWHVENAKGFTPSAEDLEELKD